jgi:cytochrome c peroxidase
MNKYCAWMAGVLLLFFYACGDGGDAPQDELTYTVDLPPGFPPMPIPDDNYLTPDRVALGKRLFYDPALSRNGNVACASCHLQDHAFADTARLSRGVDGHLGFRNAPMLFNLAWHPYFFMDGGVPTLEQQVLAPLDSPDEMDHDLASLTERLGRYPFYPALFRQAYGRDPDPWSLTRAIAAFERTLVSGNSAYDRHVQGVEPGAMDSSALRGMDLFFNRLQCGVCHSGFNFTDYSFQNIGLPETPGDSGRMRITLQVSDRGAFKTPSLRNVAVSAPYMHDGSFATLGEVIDFLASGGEHYPNQSPLTQGFAITPQEKADVIAFLNSLTDTAFLTNPEFGN